MSRSNSVPIADRFWKRLRVAESGCWEWCGVISHVGYGFIWIDGGQRYTHRTAWKLSNGDIPKGMYVCHRCDNRICCNPSHLFLGTNRENLADMRRKGRQAKGEQCNRNKLTNIAVVEIRKMLSSGWRQKDIAKRFQVDPSVISRIKTGDRNLWAHIQEGGYSNSL